ncbi:MAG: hypothetical protein KatS3mg031_1883 [Chitinophagales bacterium]|nr:MAG: hypothetical protein KatS3mg031_1883 [Chitinophagales bacterium]
MKIIQPARLHGNGIPAAKAEDTYSFTLRRKPVAAVVLCVVILLFPVWCAGQIITYSQPKKLTSRYPDFRILGKNKEGALVYRYGRNSHLVDAYGRNLTLRWSKELNFKYADVTVRKMEIYPEKTLVFYLTQQKGQTILAAEKWNARFSGDAPAVILDTVRAGRYDAITVTRIASSLDKTRLIAYYPILKEDKSIDLRLIQTDENLNILYRKTIEVSEADSAMLVRKVLPDNSGNVFVLLERETDRTRKKVAGYDVFRIKWLTPEGSVEDIHFDFKRPVFRKLYIEADNVNHSLIAAGFYTNDAGEEAQGYFYFVYDLNSRTVTSAYYMEFTSDLIFEVTGKDASKNVKGFYSFEVYDLVLRQDGGAIFIAESRFTTEENTQIATFTPSIGPSFRTINIYYYNDIILLSVFPDGKLDWSRVLRKKQISEDDDGFFSSFCTLVTGSKLRFIYNEEIYPKTDVSQYTVDRAGNIDRKFLFNAGDKNVSIIPRLGMQISANEILIPSWRRSALSFVKITY